MQLSPHAREPRQDRAHQSAFAAGRLLWCSVSAARLFRELLGRRPHFTEPLSPPGWALGSTCVRFAALDRPEKARTGTSGSFRARWIPATRAVRA